MTPIQKTCRIGPEYFDNYFDREGPANKRIAQWRKEGWTVKQVLALENGGREYLLEKVG